MIGNKKHFLVAGATGLVGSALLDMLLENETVGKVTVLARRPLALTHPKLSVREVDFEMLSEREIAPNTDAVFCCLGTTMAKAGSKEAFRQVDYEYVVKLAVFAQRQKTPQFHVISAMGANTASRFFYNRVKGRMEGELAKLDKLRSIYIYRPSLLLGPRSEHRFSENLGKNLMKAFSFLIPKTYKAVHAAEVALCMLTRAMNPKKGIHMVDNKEILEASRA